MASIRILLFVEVGAQAIGVDVLRDLVGEIHVDERLGLDVRLVAQHRIREVGARQGVLELREVIFDVRELQGVQILSLWLVHLDELLIAPQARVRRHPPPFEVSLDAVHLHDVAAGELVARSVRRKQRGNVHTVVVALDVFHQHVHAAVVAVDVELAVPPPGGVAPNFVPHLVDDGVAHQGLVRIRPMENPIVLCWHAQQRHVVVGPKGILGFERVRLLGEKLRGRAADFDGDLAVVLVGRVTQRVDSAFQVGHLHVGDDARVVQNRAVRGHLHQREGRLVHVNAGPIVLGSGIPKVHRSLIRATLVGRTASIRRALAEAGVHLDGRRDVDQESVVPIVGIGTLLTHDVFLATPVLARPVGEGVVTGEAVWHLHRDGPNAISVVVRHGIISRKPKVSAPRQKHALRGHGFVGHVQVERDKMRIRCRGLKPRRWCAEGVACVSRTQKQEGPRREV